MKAFLLLSQGRGLRNWAVFWKYLADTWQPERITWQPCIFTWQVCYFTCQTRIITLQSWFQPGKLSKKAIVLPLIEQGKLNLLIPEKPEKFKAALYIGTLTSEAQRNPFLYFAVFPQLLY